MIFAESTGNTFISWEAIATSALAVIVTLLGFWAGVVRKMITKDEVCEMITTRSPYAADRQYIMERLAVNKEMQAQLSTALQRNSEVMNELKIQIATLAKTLETLETRIDRE